MGTFAPNKKSVESNHTTLFSSTKKMKASHLWGISLFVLFHRFLAAPAYSVALIGDSLINRPSNEFDLIGKLKKNLAGYSVNFTNDADNGAQILSIKEKLPSVLETKPGVFMFGLLI